LPATVFFTKKDTRRMKNKSLKYQGAKQGAVQAAAGFGQKGAGRLET